MFYLVIHNWVTTTYSKWPFCFRSKYNLSMTMERMIQGSCFIVLMVYAFKVYTVVFKIYTAIFRIDETKDNAIKQRQLVNVLFAWCKTMLCWGIAQSFHYLKRQSSMTTQQKWQPKTINKCTNYNLKNSSFSVKIQYLQNK